MKAHEISAVSIGKKLNLLDVWRVAIHNTPVKWDESARKKVIESREYLEKRAQTGEAIYSINTGFGYLANVKVDPSRAKELQVNLLRSHAVGVGPEVDVSVVRAMMLLRAHALAQGHSGVRPELIDRLLDFLNEGISPCVPCQGSVGASGDLAPLAHMSLPLIAEGWVRVHGERCSAQSVFSEKGWKPYELSMKEGLALINGTQFMTAYAALNAVRASRLHRWSCAAAAFSVEALRGTTIAFHPSIQKVRGHPGQILAAQEIMQWLVEPNGEQSDIARSHENCGKVQDPYSFRCIPQVHGASREALLFVEKQIIQEINAVTDNPLVFPNEGLVISGGNFHGQIVSMGQDFSCIALAEMASLAEQRIQKLLHPDFSGLPAFLVKNPGINSGFMIVQVAAASLVSENKTLAHPAVVDSIPTSADKEDHVSMGAWAARKFDMVVKNCERVLVMELATAAQAFEFLRPHRSTDKVEALYQWVRSRTPAMDNDLSLADSFEAMVADLYQPNEITLLDCDTVG